MLQACIQPLPGESQQQGDGRLRPSAAAAAFPDMPARPEQRLENQEPPLRPVEQHAMHRRADPYNAQWHLHQHADPQAMNALDGHRGMQQGHARSHVHHTDRHPYSTEPMQHLPRPQQSLRYSVYPGQAASAETYSMGMPAAMWQANQHQDALHSPAQTVDDYQIRDAEVDPYYPATHRPPPGMSLPRDEAADLRAPHLSGDRQAWPQGMPLPHHMFPDEAHPVQSSYPAHYPRSMANPGQGYRDHPDTDHTDRRWPNQHSTGSVHGHQSDPYEHHQDGPSARQERQYPGANRQISYRPAAALAASSRGFQTHDGHQQERLHHADQGRPGRCEAYRVANMRRPSPDDVVVYGHQHAASPWQRHLQQSYIEQQQASHDDVQGLGRRGFTPRTPPAMQVPLLPVRQSLTRKIQGPGIHQAICFAICRHVCGITAMGIRLSAKSEDSSAEKDAVTMFNTSLSTSCGLLAAWSVLVVTWTSLKPTVHMEHQGASPRNCSSFKISWVSHRHGMSPPCVSPPAAQACARHLSKSLQENLSSQIISVTSQRPFTQLLKLPRRSGCW